MQYSAGAAVHMLGRLLLYTVYIYIYEIICLSWNSSTVYSPRGHPGSRHLSSYMTERDFTFMLHFLLLSHLLFSKTFQSGGIKIVTLSSGSDCRTHPSPPLPSACSCGALLSVFLSMFLLSRPLLMSLPHWRNINPTMSPSSSEKDAQVETDQ